MNIFLNLAEHLALTVWFGSIVFFSFFVAPVLFGVLGDVQAGKVLRSIFPRYYLLGIVCGVALSAVQAARGMLFYWGGMIVPVLVLFVLMTLVNVYARQSLTPAINAARDAGPAGKALFDRLHRRSVVLNGFVLIGGLVDLLWVAYRGF